MPRRDDIHKIMIIGSGPIIIGQACEFDYSGAQACKALREEDGWQHLRLAHINEVVYSVLPCPVEIEGNQIRAKQREQLPNIMSPQDLPKLLYIAVRQRAYPNLLQRGLAAGGGPHLVLSSQLHHQFPGHNQGFFVSQRNVFTGLNSRHRG